MEFQKIKTVEEALQKIEEMQDAVCDLNYTIILNEWTDDKFSVGYYQDEKTKKYVVYHNVLDAFVVVRTEAEIEALQTLIEVLSDIKRRRDTAIDLENVEIEKIEFDSNSHFYYKGFDISLWFHSENHVNKLEIVGKLFEDSPICGKKGKDASKEEWEEDIRDCLQRAMKVIDDTQIIDELNAIIGVVRGGREKNPAMKTLLEKYLLARKQFILDGDIRENVASSARELLGSKKAES